MFMKLAFASSSTKQIFLAQLKILSQINKHISKSKYISLNQPQDLCFRTTHLIIKKAQQYVSISASTFRFYPVITWSSSLQPLCYKSLSSSFQSSKKLKIQLIT